MPSLWIWGRLCVPMLVATATVTLWIGWQSGQSLRAIYQQSTIERLTAEHRHLESLLWSDRFDRLDVESAREFVKVASSISPEIRVTVIGLDGGVWADSAVDAFEMPSQRGRAEVEAALSGQTGHDLRRSDTIGQISFYLARPLFMGDTVAAVLRTALPLPTLDRELGVIRHRLIAAATLLLAVILGSTAAAAIRLHRPIAEIAEVARRLAAGDLSCRVPDTGCTETDALAQSLNNMAAELQRRIQVAESQQREMETMLESLTEGVLAIDSSERVLFGNRRAVEILGARLRRGADLRETVRFVELQQILVRALRERTDTTADVSFTDGRTQRFIHGRAAPLTDPIGGTRGAVMVLNDFTEMNRLMTLRREFVANVTHELQTPLTTIRGFLETLVDSHPPSPEDQQRFLQITLRQTRRLQRLVEDLMELARLDQAAEQSVVRPVATTSGTISNDAAEACAALASERNVRIEVRGALDIPLQADADLLTRALVNLLDNAIKYSPAGSAVEIECHAEDGQIVWSVTDHGPGIEAIHLPRLFERFYRVDKGRSRREGGTGLGLAIVKHIVLAHGGTVGVESEVGRGSRFWFKLPQHPTPSGVTRFPNNL